MDKISSREIIDVVKYTNDKIILVEKMSLLEGGYKANYFIIDLNTLEKEVVTKNAYLIRKFGNSAFQKINETIADFADCEAAILPNKNVFVIFSNGQCGLFDPHGEVLWEKELSYNGKRVTGLALDGECVWCCCTDENCVIRYIVENNKLNVDLRIGSKETATFSRPVFVSSDDEGVYVCCSNRLRKISKADFVVSDVSEKLSGLKRFYRFGDYSLVCMSDGAYIAKSE